MICAADPGRFDYLGVISAESAESALEKARGLVPRLMAMSSASVRRPTGLSLCSVPSEWVKAPAHLPCLLGREGLLRWRSRLEPAELESEPRAIIQTVKDYSALSTFTRVHRLVGRDAGGLGCGFALHG